MPEYPARNPAKASRSGLENTGPAGTRAAEVVVVVMRHLPYRAETRGLGGE